MRQDHTRMLALYGPASPTLSVASAASLRAEGNAAAAAALHELSRYRPLALYAGPQDAQAVASWLPLSQEKPPPLQEPEPLVPEETAFVASRGSRSRVKLYRWSEPYDPGREALYALLEAHL